MKSFSFPQKIMFKHCDPAGIVFYPRYFEIINDVVETFFADGLGIPFDKLLAEAGVPTATTSATFHAPSYHGDHLVITLKVTRLGQTSVSLDFQAACGDQARFSATSTLVYVNSEGRPQSWSPAFRTAFLPYLEEDPT